MYVTTPVAKKYYSVSSDTLRRWADAGKIDFILTKGNHRRYFVPDPVEENEQSPDSTKYIYVRVSSYKQKSDLQHQLDFLSNLFPNHSVISDIGSGLNFRRKGLKTLLDKVFKNELSEVVVASRDRLARFGYELLEDIFARNNAKIVVVNSTKRKQFEEELSEDILSIVTYFTAKYSGHRKYKKAIKDETDNDSEKGSNVGSDNDSAESESSKDDESETGSDRDSESEDEPKERVIKGNSKSATKQQPKASDKKVIIKNKSQSKPTKQSIKIKKDS
ncbi:putative resolvase [Yasminevirus sp. GU-2018]|uniref:Putative resolvase n=1 Tax=Yasminevirus sp. GU-2018 TaxID=2420051 RepID=A0A5K0U807_9VIRU|nr:putative resolvase [Yasminevirus sp. GU-2018]